MDLTKIYHDVKDKRCNILELVKYDPIWAANRIQMGERAIAELAELKKENRQVDDQEWLG